MGFDEFKKDFEKIAELDGVKATDEELTILFIAQIVLNSYQRKQESKYKKRRNSI